LNNYVGDIVVSFSAPSGSGFSSSSGLVIAKASLVSSTTTSIKSVEEIPATGGQIDTITIMEDSTGSLDFRENQSFKLEILTEGCSWAPISEQGDVTYGWSFPPSSNESLTEAGARAWTSGKNNEILNYKVNNLDHRFYSPGKILFNSLKIEVDPHKVMPGQEIKVKISGYDMDKTTLVVAKYAAHHNLQGKITLENSSDHSGILVTLYDQSDVISQTVTDANGRFVFSNIPAGIYDLTVSRSNWLSNKIYDITIHPGKTTVTEPISLWFGDLNNDNTVDLFDLAKLCQNYGRSGL
ncbi:MAG: carboxypeptidase-like regulatory domain-containing protein, partial [Syntrophomonadaceae bacterium]|nr:carboxypeptidase-like regulatory domain-containing protein [Syntrophomonadaceae bacterium]